MDAEYLAAGTSLSWLPEEPIASFRRAYDPTADVFGPHITLVFPVPASEVNHEAFREHVRNVASGRRRSISV